MFTVNIFTSKTWADYPEEWCNVFVTCIHPFEPDHVTEIQYDMVSLSWNFDSEEEAVDWINKYVPLVRYEVYRVDVLNLSR